MVRDTRLTCGCCGKKESTGGCVRGVVNCSCERARDFLLSLNTDLCADCKKCPAHCICEMCNCRKIINRHSSDCRVRLKCRYKIRRDKAKAEIETAELLLKSLEA